LEERGLNMKKIVMILSMFIGIQSWAAETCSNGQSTVGCSCNQGYTAKCEWNGGPFCQNSNSLQSDEGCNGCDLRGVLPGRKIVSGRVIPNINGKVRVAGPKAK
jgi:hypothetical protein